MVDFQESHLIRMVTKIIARNTKALAEQHGLILPPIVDIHWNAKGFCYLTVDNIILRLLPLDQILTSRIVPISLTEPSEQANTPSVHYL